MEELWKNLEVALADRYRLERELGAGGMATVYLAHDVRHDRKVAVKVLRRELAAAIGAERFLAEIKTTANLQHPHILPLFDSGEADSFLYYVMPCVTGESLRDRLTREGQLPLDEVLKITGELAEALDYAHAQGVVHRDIKPENILFQAGHASICDFGIARAITEAGGAHLTGTGMAIGTPAYMSPEQATGGTLDNRTDIYALGCVVYEMLAGEPPYTGPTAQAILSRRLTEPVPPLHRTREGMPAALDFALRQAMARSPADRFRTAAQFAAALGAGGPTAPSRADRRAGWKISAAAVGLLVLAALAWAILRPRAGPSAPLSDSRLAVFPFAVRATEAEAYLGEGVVDLLSRNLDGFEGLRTVDPGTILTAIGKSGSGPLDSDRARSMARRVGAGLYVTGSVYAVGGQLRIQAQLYDANKGTPGVALAQASVDGAGGEVFRLMDQLASRLIVATRGGAVHRLIETAALTTTSLPALKEYLNAEAALRAGNKDTAIAGFRRALDADSTFALAYYRLAVAAGWHDRQDLAGWATGRALAMSDRLVERDRRLLGAYAAFRRGAVDSAESFYRGLLRDYPDDLEAQFQLADLLYQYNPLRGRPRSEARELFDAVLAYDPGFL